MVIIQKGKRKKKHQSEQCINNCFWGMKTEKNFSTERKRKKKKKETEINEA